MKGLCYLGAFVLGLPGLFSFLRGLGYLLYSGAVRGALLLVVGIVLLFLAWQCLLTARKLTRKDAAG